VFPVPTVQRAAIAGTSWTVPASTVFSNRVNNRVQIKMRYRRQPKQSAAALWGDSAAQYR
jgi:hypothetical protein